MENTGSQVVSLEQQVESVERSIVFLRQEQLSLLHGLHLEILSLQKRCTELTQELNMKPPGRSEAEVTEEEEQLEARCEEVEEHLQEQQQIQSDLRWELSQKSVLVGALRASLKEKERHFLEELKHRSHRTTVLNTELQKQTEAAAYLSFQLHSAKQKLHQQRQQQQHRRPAQSGVDKPPIHPSPQASASSLTTIKPKRRSSSRPSSHLHTERARECVPRERVTGPEEPMAMPDPALFFYPYRHRSRLRPPHKHALQEAEGEESEELDQGASVSRLATTVAKATATTASTTENNAE
ncbi:coiled-coil domain-containing protein 92-like isoform X1 [Sinocyclocheilus rhinocerous]|uniref:coiled-coil domain-containing protein 92-like isoform X1 n=1 Tax=Sinocyclocheilus rhinocerous TaxID=307959 RepID=UPI0007B944D5|nr:PREDICTED: coiled-coil domain-containing protein 92-like isoform X1 [Sinocyclocheilus rhinocerous]